jgi:hypothetical protein
VVGTEPRDTCDQATGIKGFFSRIFGSGNSNVLPPPPANAPEGQVAQNAQNQGEPQKKKGFFGKIAGIFKDDKSSSTPSKQPSNNGNQDQNSPH